MEKVDVGKYIVIDPEVCHGQMTFRGTRVPVDTVLTFLGKGYSVDLDDQLVDIEVRVQLAQWTTVQGPPVSQTIIEERR